ncbi:unnamed protein product [Cyclocybe aegerita]|uniref:Uncharacterized protein n=1 Tax=Cyclocybe aegerita TaxID=1973307 RepID=A0A8S0XDR1_CYCAE|nr:unnamed protein product [Cyclocybe aegerita]
MYLHEVDDLLDLLPLLLFSPRPPADMRNQRKRKRDAARLPRISYDAATRTFDRLFKEDSLEGMKQVVRRKLGVPHHVPVYLSQMREGKSVDLEDDDDFEAFKSAAYSASVMAVQVTLGGNEDESGSNDKAGQSSSLSRCSNLASVVRPSAIGSSVKLGSDRPLGVFHTKFWGTSMEEERKAWSKAEGQVPWNESEMDLDDDGEADIISGCYPLIINIKGIKPSSLWVRAEYIRIFDACVRICQEGTGRRITMKPPSFVITGQPGIDSITLFVEEGAYELPATWRQRDFFPDDPLWVFIDAESDSATLSKLFTVGTKMAIFFTTSPDEERWHRFNKTTSRNLLVMNPWGKEEMKQAAHLYGLSEDIVLEKYDCLGPIPRLCIDFSATQLSTYESMPRTTLNSITIESDEPRVALALFGLAQRTTVPYSPGRSNLSAHPDETRQPTSQLPQSREAAGVFFEVAAQTLFAQTIELTLLPMVKLDSRGEKNLLHWYSSHIPLTDQELEQQRTQVVAEELHITPSRTIEYPETGLDSILSDVYYVPQRPNEDVVDSFILSDGKLFLFQCSTASRRSIKSRITLLAARCRFPPQKDWRLVFVIPPKQALTVPQEPAVEKAALFTAVVDINRISL